MAVNRDSFSSTFQPVCLVGLLGYERDDKSHTSVPRVPIHSPHNHLPSITRLKKPSRTGAPAERTWVAPSVSTSCGRSTCEGIWRVERRVCEESQPREDPVGDERGVDRSQEAQMDEMGTGSREFPWPLHAPHTSYVRLREIVLNSLLSISPQVVIYLESREPTEIIAHSITTSAYITWPPNSWTTTQVLTREDTSVSVQRHP